MRRAVVVVTRAGGREDPLGAALRKGGAEMVWLPTTATLPPIDPSPLDAALERLGEVDWVVFTSGHAVEAVCARPRWPAAWSAAAPRRPRVAAVGTSTARRLGERGIGVDLVPPQASAASLVAALLAAGNGPLRGRRVLWPRSDIARRELPDGLVAAGAVVEEPIAYRTVAAIPGGLEGFRRDLEAGRIDAVCFLSPSAADGLARALGSDLSGLAGRCLVASLGPATSGALARLGAAPDVEAARHTPEGLAEALLPRLPLLEGASR